MPTSELSMPSGLKSSSLSEEQSIELSSLSESSAKALFVAIVMTEKKEMV